MSEQTVLPLDKIRIDGETQTRVEIDEATVKEYAEASEHTTLPRSEVVFDGVNYWLWDGFHRYHAARRRKAQALACNVTKGTADDARWLACGANKSHGLKRTNADKRKSVTLALKQRPQMSDRAIAEHCGVGADMVGDARRQVSESDTCQPTKRTGRDNKSYPASPRKKPAPPPEPADPQPSEEESQAAGERLIKQAAAASNGSHKGGKKKTPEKQEEVYDALGNRLPPTLRDVFADRTIHELLAKLRAASEGFEHAAAVRKLASISPYHKWLKLPLATEFVEEASANLRAAADHVAAAIPYAICPHCLETAAGCESCRGAAYVPKWRHDELEAQAALEGKAS